MIKGTRARERTFTIAMWVLSVVFAGFLIGLGRLVIGDLPRVSAPVELSSFVDPAEDARLTNERARLEAEGIAIQRRLDAADAALNIARGDYQAAQTTFDNWIATRTATTDPAQDPEVVSRTRALDVLKGLERTVEIGRDQVQTERTANYDAVAANDAARAAMGERAQPHYERARFAQELQVFGLRLAFTLPLLAISAFFLLQKNKGDYWPLKRGFIIASAFAFFVELVPYLPEYGGYVRYGVGILLTIIASHFVIRWMRNYLKSREAAEAKAETERKQAIQYDEALKKLGAKTCPGCDRMLTPTDTPADFCMHCGMELFNHCPQCATRKFAFFRFCMKCGAKAEGKAAAPA
ncbi:MAG: hypothetical protein JNJ73_12185 [Hyphomonadaceae bacterium]|nr:hypothetical protein [Hyphomonadaceae bacterium]